MISLHGAAKHQLLYVNENQITWIQENEDGFTDIYLTGEDCITVFEGADVVMRKIRRNDDERTMFSSNKI